MPASRSLRKRPYHRLMNRESHSSLCMIVSRDSPSSSIKIGLALRTSAARTVRLRAADCNCSRSVGVRFIFPMHPIWPDASSMTQ